MPKNIVSQRQIETRTPHAEKTNTIRYRHFVLSDIKQHFDEAIDSVVLLEQMVSQQQMTRDQIQVLRWTQIALVCSAFDFYIHELYRYVSAKAFLDEWKPKLSFLKTDYSCTYLELKELLNAEEKVSVFYQQISRKIHQKSFINAEKVKDFLNNINISFAEVCSNCKLGIDDCLKKIDTLFTLRHTIVHQAGRRAADASLISVDADFVDGCVAFVRQFIDIIHRLASAKN